MEEMTKIIEEKGWDFRLLFEYRKSERGTERERWRDGGEGEVVWWWVGVCVCVCERERERERDEELGMEEMWVKVVKREN